MGETSSYCNDCYGLISKPGTGADASVVAAEKAGKVPMTKQGACSKCGKATVVIYYDT